MIIGYLSLLLGCNTDTTNEEKNYDGQNFSINCEALQEHFVTTQHKVLIIGQVTGVFSESNGCQGEGCSWNNDDLQSM